MPNSIRGNYEMTDNLIGKLTSPINLSMKIFVISKGNFSDQLNEDNKSKLTLNSAALPRVNNIFLGWKSK